MRPSDKQTLQHLIKLIQVLGERKGNKSFPASRMMLELLHEFEGNVMGTTKE